MSVKAAPLQVNLFHGQIVAVYEDLRSVDIKWIQMDTIKRNVFLVQDSSTYSFPRVGEMGLVIGSDVSKYYYLGKIDFGFSQKLSGDEKMPKSTTPWPVQLINAGEQCMMHISNGIKLLMTNDGGFKLAALIGDGVNYVADKSGAPIRWLTSAAMSIWNKAGTSETHIGNVIRSLPGLGDTTIFTPATVIAQEFLARVTKLAGAVRLDSVKLQLGDIFVEPVAAMVGVPTPHSEIGVAGLAAFLRALLAVYDTTGMLELSSVKMDDKGNISINANLPGTGKIVINSAVPAASVFVGCNSDNVTEPAVKGQSLLSWLTTHKHASSVGPTGPVMPEDTATLPTILSLKVFVA